MYHQRKLYTTAHPGEHCTGHLYHEYNGHILAAPILSGMHYFHCTCLYFTVHVCMLCNANYIRRGKYRLRKQNDNSLS